MECNETERGKVGKKLLGRNQQGAAFCWRHCFQFVDGMCLGQHKMTDGHPPQACHDAAAAEPRADVGTQRADVCSSRAGDIQCKIGGGVGLCCVQSEYPDFTRLPFHRDAASREVDQFLPVLFERGIHRRNLHNRAAEFRQNRFQCGKIGDAIVCVRTVPLVSWVSVVIPRRSVAR